MNASSPFNNSLPPPFESSSSSYAPQKMTAKRVILRLRDNDFPDVSYADIVACVQAFLSFSSRSPDELSQARHFFHFQPPNPHILQPNPRFHIIIDIEKTKHSGRLPEDFPHEIYRISRLNGEMYVFHDEFRTPRTNPHLVVVLFRSKIQKSMTTLCENCDIFRMRSILGASRKSVSRPMTTDG